MTPDGQRPVRIANISGFYGDRFNAMSEQLAGGQVDVLTGDYLAELTMLILARTRQRTPDGGYARSFIGQLDGSLSAVVEQGAKVVVNAGGLDPVGCASAVSDLIAASNASLSVAAITGDDLMPHVSQLREEGETFAHIRTGEAPLADFLVANAYMGGWGITEALRAGADIVITGRVADASLVSGVSAWWHGWQRTDFDQLAGAVVAGHVVECGAQATGGNYSFVAEHPEPGLPGFPWVDVAADGSFVVGKHEGTGGSVSVATVTSQLLYEIEGPRYLGPDVVAHFDTIRLAQVDKDRVKGTGIHGSPPPERLKVGAASAGGYRNEVMVGLTGRGQGEKAALLSHQVWRALGSRDQFDAVEESVLGAADPEGATFESQVSFWRVAVRSHDERIVGRRFSDAITELALSSIPGMFLLAPPAHAQQVFGFWPTTVSRSAVRQRVEIGGAVFEVGEISPRTCTDVATTPPETQPSLPSAPDVSADTTLAPLGTIIGARSGDKGGDANLGVLCRNRLAFTWLEEFLTSQRLAELMPDVGVHPIERYEFPNLLALNFVVRGILGEGVGSSLRVDRQAKGLAEYLRSRMAPIPTELLEA